MTLTCRHCKQPIQGAFIIATQWEMYNDDEMREVSLWHYRCAALKRKLDSRQYPRSIVEGWVREYERRGHASATFE